MSSRVKLIFFWCELNSWVRKMGDLGTSLQVGTNYKATKILWFTEHPQTGCGKRHSNNKCHSISTSTLRKLVMSWALFAAARSISGSQWYSASYWEQKAITSARLCSESIWVFLTLFSVLLSQGACWAPGAIDKGNSAALSGSPSWTQTNGDPRRNTFLAHNAGVSASAPWGKICFEFHWSGDNVGGCSPWSRHKNLKLCALNKFCPRVYCE